MISCLFSITSFTIISYHLYILSYYILSHFYYISFLLKYEFVDTFPNRVISIFEQRTKYDECIFFVCLDVVGRILPKRYSSREQEDQ